MSVTSGAMPNCGTYATIVLCWPGARNEIGNAEPREETETRSEGRGIVTSPRAVSHVSLWRTRSPRSSEVGGSGGGLLEEFTPQNVHTNQTSGFANRDMSGETSLEPPPESVAEAKLRFEAELEFVQALANPEYLHYLAQNRYFDDARFVDYIDYLQYWRELPYCLHITFPHSLKILELLQTERFVTMLKRPDFKDGLARQQHWHWLMRADMRRASQPQQQAQNEGGAALGSLEST